jgi:hypothetical protein
MPEDPEELLRAAGRPRPLPPRLRARLEEALLGRQVEARSLPPEVRGRLEVELRPQLSGARQQEGEPKKKNFGKSRRNLGKWWPIAATAGLAAAAAVLVGLLVPGFVHSPRPEAHNAAGAFGTAQKSAKKTSSARGVLARSTPKASPTGAPAGLAKPAPHTVAGTTLKKPVGAVAMPLVSSVSPRRGPSPGGNVVTLLGTGLGSARAIYFGGAKAPRFEVVSSHELKAVAPAHRPGSVYVVVATPALRSPPERGDTYTYTP